MERLCLRSLLLLTACAPALGQVGPGGGSPALVDHFSWNQEHRLPADFGFSMFRAEAGFDQAQATVAPPLTAGDPAGKSGSRASGTRLGRSGTAKDSPSGSSARDFYRYRVTLENHGRAAIRSVVWDYVFRDPASNQVLRVVRFSTEAKIKPGKSKVLEGYTAQPPVNVANVAALKETGDRGRGESVEIVRIQFADRSVWTRSR